MRFHFSNFTSLYYLSNLLAFQFSSFTNFPALLTLQLLTLLILLNLRSQNLLQIFPYMFDQKEKIFYSVF